MTRTPFEQPPRIRRDETLEPGSTLDRSLREAAAVLPRRDPAAPGSRRAATKPSTSNAGASKRNA